jgi:soluble lytic murein transglycosylase-like protein
MTSDTGASDAPNPPPPAPGPDLRNINATNTPIAERLAAFKPLFDAADANHGLPPGLTARIAYVESRYNPQAQSPAGAIGIMQLEPSSFPGVDPWDPIAAIDAGANYLATLYQQFGSWQLATAAYNAGPGNVRKHGNQVPLFPETLAYVQSTAGFLGLA